MKNDVLIAILGGSGFGAIVAAIIAGIFSKKKLGAEATEIITKAAAGVVVNMEADMKRMKTERSEERTEHESVVATLTRDHAVAIQAITDKMDTMARDHAAEREDWRRVLQLHVAWDALAIAKLAEVDIELPPAPPLLPVGRKALTD